MRRSFSPLIQQHTDDAITLRHHIHQHPELRYEEHQTASLVVDELKKYGYTNIQTGVGGTGVVALLDSGKPGPVVALRADMDALPIQETSQLAYQSTIDGKMHACGHDGHTATLLLTARVLQASKHLLPGGQVKFIFQPAEEGGAGAKAMIDDGVLLNPQVDAIFGYHNYHLYPPATFAVKDGSLMAGNSNFHITIKGQGAHAACPHESHDPIIASTALVQAVQTIISRSLSPLKTGLISITQISAGTATNIIPDTAYLAGTLRGIDAETIKTLKKQLITLSHQICTAYNTTANVQFEKNAYPPLVNSKNEARFVYETAKVYWAKDSDILWLDEPICLGSEDFAFFLEHVPGCYFAVGNGSPEHAAHTSNFDFNDNILACTADFFCQLAFSYLSENKGVANKL